MSFGVWTRAISKACYGEFSAQCFMPGIIFAPSRSSVQGLALEQDRVLIFATRALHQC